MKIIKNEKLIERNGKIGQWMSLASLIVLGLGLYISFTVPEYFIYSIVCLVIGFTMTQISIYMGNRWGRSPRADEKFDAGLKGLHSDFVIYHFSSPVSHLLIGPSGAWVLHPLHQRGKISYQKNRWKLSNGGFLQAYMSVFGQEGLGRPEIDAENEVQALRKFLAKKMDESTIPEIKPILVFTNDEIEVDAGDSPIAAMRLKQLKEFMRQGGKNRSLSNEQIKALSDALES
ncbi:MAG TPA: hypothetical protein PKE35_04090 [Anaerolineales bacterium]|nr:hypothetical protein [Anaerolineales bacterium]HMX73407.1 hypothetical protein [Anaerolineales bacterium]HMZ42049.1 hypothetical protein [Anaerolineales bacterium]HNA53512.1 hypothetical protein [Anaerolineales bacterium]HNE68296.1 hypothetical protein [Anaerolineales bacterium]